MCKNNKEQSEINDPQSPCGQVKPIVSKPLLLHGDCRKYLFDFIEADSIDLTVTSPPYDNLRTYNNSSTWGWAEFSAIAAGLWRVTKPGGVVVWVVGDATIKGSETGSSFEQALAFKKMGFNLHDTMIYEKAQACFGSNNCYLQSFEYMFVFSKGKPRVMNFLRDRENVRGGVTEGTVKHGTKPDGSRGERVQKTAEKLGKRKNIWRYAVGGGNTGHPAVFPQKLAEDHIATWSNPGDTVLDPFLGSGTTGVACKNLGRNFIGIELDENYYQIATKRIDSC